jgi:glutaminase
MKITSFNPIIITKDSESLIKMFEELGFEKTHQKDGINGDITSVRMKDANGFHVDVTQANNTPQDMTAIRMNVSDFDEAYKFLTDKGFKNAQGDKITETGSSRSTMMISPSGFGISVTEHIKK